MLEFAIFAGATALIAGGAYAISLLAELVNDL